MTVASENNQALLQHLDIVGDACLVAAKASNQHAIVADHVPRTHCKMTGQADGHHLAHGAKSDDKMRCAMAAWMAQWMAKWMTGDLTLFHWENV